MTASHAAPPGPEPRFLCDAMLGRLARWLRALGIDAAYEPEVGDAALVRRARAEERTILTCDRRLPAEHRAEECVVLASGDTDAALREVATRFALRWPRELFRRCLECNQPLEPVPHGDVRALVPPAVREAHRDFRRCPSCARIYWEGSHTRRLRHRLEAVLADR